MTERQIQPHLPQRGLLQILHQRAYMLCLPTRATNRSLKEPSQHIGIRAVWEREKMTRNAIKSMHTYRNFAVMSTEEQKRVYEKFIYEFQGQDQGKLGRQRGA